MDIFWFDLTFTNFYMQCQKLGVILQNKYFKNYLTQNNKNKTYSPNFISF